MFSFSFFLLLYIPLYLYCFALNYQSYTKAYIGKRWPINIVSCLNTHSRKLMSYHIWHSSLQPISLMYVMPLFYYQITILPPCFFFCFSFVKEEVENSIKSVTKNWNELQTFFLSGMFKSKSDIFQNFPKHSVTWVLDKL